MLLEAWQQGQQFIHFDDTTFADDFCDKAENHFTTDNYSASLTMISMKGCLIMYASHKAIEIQVVQSQQDSNIAILSFQLNGQMRVNESHFEPYRIFENDIHNTFFTNKRELVFEAPLVFENFRIILSPKKFQELLAKFHGRFSIYAEKIKLGEYFDLYEMPLPITPKMKMIIHDIIHHKISDNILSKVFYETKITELFGCQLEQIYSSWQNHSTELSATDKQKIYEARELLVRNLQQSPPTIPQLARMTGTNENKLKSGFRAIFSKSIYNYLLSHRMENAVEMLEDPKLSLDEIAERVGYGDTAHFSRAFRKVKGIPPGQFRKELNDR
jgi:AraC family transcriptional regulator, transcriptional activator of the genes for pyochelin and ferripyochelin receptors